MAHIPTHLGRKTHERTHGIDVRTRGIDERTRLARERTRLLRTNPRGRVVAGSESFSLYYNALVIILQRSSRCRAEPLIPLDHRAPNKPDAHLTPVSFRAIIPKSSKPNSPRKDRWGVGSRCLPTFLQNSVASFGITAPWWRTTVAAKRLAASTDWAMDRPWMRAAR